MNRLFRSVLEIKRIKALANHEYFKTQSWRTGVPFLIFILGSGFWLKEFTSLKYDEKYRKVKKISDEDEKAIRSHVATKTIEEVYYDQIQKHGVSKGYEMIRGPREGEDSRLIQEEYRKQLAASRASSQVDTLQSLLDKKKEK